MTSASVLPTIGIDRHVVGENIWLCDRNADAQAELMSREPQLLRYEVLDSEAAGG